MACSRGSIRANIGAGAVINIVVFLRWHRGIVKRQHARTSRPKPRGRPPAVRSVRTLLWLYRALQYLLLYRELSPYSATIAT